MARLNDRGLFLRLWKSREAEWLFNSNDGRRQLAENANFQRLVIIHLGRDHQFGSLQCVQDELASVVSSLQPKDLAANSKVRDLISHLYEFVSKAA